MLALKAINKMSGFVNRRLDDIDLPSDDWYNLWELTASYVVNREVIKAFAFKDILERYIDVD